MLMSAETETTTPSIEVVDLSGRVVLRSRATGAIVLSDEVGRAALDHVVGESEDATVERIARLCGISRSGAARVLEQTLAAWKASGLLSDRPLGFPNAPATPRTGAPASADFGRDGESIRVISDEPDLVARARIAFRPHVADPGSAPSEVIDIRRGRDGYTVFRNGSAEWGTTDADPLRFYIFQELVAFLAGRRIVGAIVHGAVVTRSSGALVLAGPTGHGKTTLALNLSSRGWRLACDDLFALHADGRNVVSVPMWAHIKSGGTRWTDRYIDPPRSVPGGQRLRVRGIVFPTYRPGAALEHERLTPEEAFMGLLRSGTEVARPNGSIAPLVAFVSGTPAWRLTYGATEDAIRFCNDASGDADV